MRPRTLAAVLLALVVALAPITGAGAPEDEDEIVTKECASPMTLGTVILDPCSVTGNVTQQLEVRVYANVGNVGNVLVEVEAAGGARTYNTCVMLDTGFVCSFQVSHGTPVQGAWTVTAHPIMYTLHSQPPSFRMEVDFW